MTIPLAPTVGASGSLTEKVVVDPEVAGAATEEATEAVGCTSDMVDDELASGADAVVIVMVSDTSSGWVTA